MPNERTSDDILKEYHENLRKIQTPQRIYSTRHIKKSQPGDDTLDEQTIRSHCAQMAHHVQDLLARVESQTLSLYSNYSQIQQNILLEKKELEKVHLIKATAEGLTALAKVSQEKSDEIHEQMKEEELKFQKELDEKRLQLDKELDKLKENFEDIKSSYSLKTEELDSEFEEKKAKKEQELVAFTAELTLKKNNLNEEFEQNKHRLESEFDATKKELEASFKEFECQEKRRHEQKWQEQALYLNKNNELTEKSLEKIEHYKKIVTENEDALLLQSDFLQQLQHDYSLKNSKKLQHTIEQQYTQKLSTIQSSVEHKVKQQWSEQKARYEKHLQDLSSALLSQKSALEAEKKQYQESLFKVENTTKETVQKQYQHLFLREKSKSNEELKQLQDRIDQLEQDLVKKEHENQKLQKELIIRNNPFVPKVVSNPETNTPQPAKILRPARAQRSYN